MHPAYSVIVFTVASGAGYGLAVWVGVLLLVGEIELGSRFAAVALSIATVLIAGGLASSMAHLGRPERAWRALSQWRSSWLSREGVAAAVSFGPIMLLLFGAALGGLPPWLERLGAGALLALSVATVTSTAMIYATLKPVPAWRDPLVVPVYLIMAAAAGAVLYCAIAALAGRPLGALATVSILLLFAVWVLKAVYWFEIDIAKPIATTGTATGLGRFGEVRQIEPPHIEENFLLREMGFRVARSHSEKLRGLAILLFAVVPSMAIAAVAWIGPGGLAALLGLVAGGVSLAGALIERWLFFAEARHVVTTFYDQTSV